MSRKKKILLGMAGILLAGGAGVAFWLHRKTAELEPLAKEKLIEYLERRFDSSVELTDLDITAAPGVRVVGRGLVLRHRRRTDIPPLIKVQQFSFETSWPELAAPVSHISLVRLDGLEINTPPRPAKPNPPPADSASTPPAAPPSPPEPSGPTPDQREGSFVVDQIVADRAILRMLPRDPNKTTGEYELHELRIAGAGKGQPMTYYTKMRNYKPPGTIESRGQFGPWNAEEPGLTPLGATYTFANADLGVFKGISGTLQSTGKFSGELNRIVVDGETRTPDFSLKMSGNRVRLLTKFHAIVDGTDGDTYLDPVEATLGQSRMIVRGAVTGDKVVKGKSIALDTTMRNGRLEDILQLAAKGKTPMTGAVDLKVKLIVPRGDEDVIDKLGLDGSFKISKVRFSDPAIQGKIDELSRRGQGRPGDEGVAEMRSDMNGVLALRDTVARFSSLQYAVEGADVDVAGQYGLKSEELDFDGVLRMDAKMSQTFRGMKSLMLKPFDGLFSRGNRGMVLSITISGTRDHPKFGLDVKRTFGKKDQ